MDKHKNLCSACGRQRAARADGVESAAMMAVLRGKGRGLEIALGGRDFEEALVELQSKLDERPGFYSGSSATAWAGRDSLSEEQLSRLRVLLQERGLTLVGLTGSPVLQPLAAALGLQFDPADDGGEELARRRALRPKREVHLSDAARSLVADFAGARADIATRRKRGEASVRRVVFADASAALPDAPADLVNAAESSTLYHTGTLRGGQSLHHLGNIVVVGDVNPGAELVASGDIVVFGALRGVAHAGAQGDANARVYAIVLAPTQLRIASFIAAEANGRAHGSGRPEAACIRDERITIFSREQTPP